jgi:hypothetical protein
VWREINDDIKENGYSISFGAQRGAICSSINDKKYGYSIYFGAQRGARVVVKAGTDRERPTFSKVRTAFKEDEVDINIKNYETAFRRPTEL